ncbi:hypothetical protein SteCoe_25876 [Stentor coeruleus]|uniref:Uncharacterized protein n=1 Tax=Stentor coeruleus TaxID=5963 RepID=A0A1R2BEK1_9CILI|nr:hypothetical protein SteCoe_25876 [Stentor coeruleus]
MSSYFGLDKIKRFLTFDDIPTEWVFQDYSKGHLAVLHILLITTFLFQVFSFITATILLNFSELDLSLPIIEDPYFECINWGIIVFLSLFQSLALFKNPHYITPYISKKLSYSNFTISILNSIFVITKSIEENNFFYIFNTILGAISLILTINAYKTARKEHKKLNINKKIEFLGFGVLYSLLLPLIIIEFMTSLTFSINAVGTGLASDEAKVVFFVFCMFIIGFIMLLWEHEFYMSGTIIFHIIGIYCIQKREICEFYKENCSESIQIVCSVMAIGLLVCLGVTVVLEINVKNIVWGKKSVLE